MARKKKTEELVNVDSGSWPKVTQGSHLTVTTHKDGSTELKWDHDALLRDVQEAIASVSTNIVAATEDKVKKTRARKTKVSE